MKKFKKSFNRTEEEKNTTLFNVIKSSLLFTVIFYFIGIILVLATSVVAYRSSDPSKYIEYLGKICLFVSALISGFMMAKKQGQKYILNGLILGSFILSSIFITSLFSDSDIIQNNLIWYILIPMSTVLGNILGIKREKNKHRKRKMH